MSHTTATVTDRSLNQRMDALRRANDVRQRRAALRRDLRDGRVSIAEVLLDPPDHARTAAAFDLLRSAPKVGRVTATRALRRAGVSPTTQLGRMTDRQRRALAALLSWGAER